MDMLVGQDETVCFFFKQKTAYEVRISDWSSDVCSSDLVRPRTFSALGYAAMSCNTLGEAVALIPRYESLVYDGGSTVVSEIGRASCRDRVVSVRVDLVGRRIIKKKTHIH